MSVTGRFYPFKLMGQIVQRLPVDVSGLRKILGVRLIAQTPYDDTGMIPVPCDHIAQHPLMIVIQRKGVVRFNLVARTDADDRHFIDDQNAFTVAQIVPLLSTRGVTHA